MKITYPTKTVSRIYKVSPKLNSKKMTQFKIGKVLGDTSLKRIYTDSKETYEKLFNIIGQWGNADLNYCEITPHIY